MVVDDLGDDEAEPLLGEGRIEVGLLGEGPQARDLGALAIGIRGREPGRRLQSPDLLGELESFGEQMHEGRIDVVDALPQPGEFAVRTVVSHSPRLLRAESERTIAEGVEQPEQRKALAELGCTHIQGYLFSPAMPGDQTCKFIEQHSAPSPNRMTTRPRVATA